MRRRVPLVLAALLLGLAALLLSLSEGGRPAQARAEPSFPRWLREGERERNRARRILPPPPAPAEAEPDDEAPEPPAPPRDPFLLALPRDPGKGLLVLEANALRHSRLGELFVACALRRSRDDPFDELRRETGVDPLKDLDRVAFSPDGVIVFGFLDRARLEALAASATPSPRGEHGRLYLPAGGGAEPLAIGTWRDRVIAFGTPAFVSAALDRLDGRGAGEPPLLPEHLTYGEAYGVVPGAALRPLFRGGQEALGDRLASAASRIELHADAMRDVAVVARVSGESASEVADLGKALGAALAVGRVQAALGGNAELAELLEHARVVREGGNFSLELALPVALVERWFAGCGDPAPAQR